jgi:hypothetical protein
LIGKLGRSLGAPSAKWLERLTAVQPAGVGVRIGGEASNERSRKPAPELAANHPSE